MLSSCCSARLSAVMLLSIIRSLFLLSALSPKRFMYHSSPPQLFVTDTHGSLSSSSPKSEDLSDSALPGLYSRFQCMPALFVCFLIKTSAETVCICLHRRGSRCFFAFALKGDGAGILFHQGLCNDELYFWVMFWYSESQTFARWRVQDESSMMSSMPAEERVKQHQRLVVTLIWMFNLKTVRHSCYCATPALIGVRGLQARNVAPVTGCWDLPWVLEGVTRRAQVPRTRWTSRPLLYVGLVERCCHACGFSTSLELHF